MNGDAVLGTLNGVEMTIDRTLDLLSRMDPDAVIGQPPEEEHPVTVGEFARRLRRLAAMPPVVPMEERLSDQEWAEAVIVRGEAPYGRCDWCGTALGAAGCLNLCDMPAAAAQEFNEGILNHLNERRAQTRWLETLGGCTCGPANLSGYAVERDSHDPQCPMHPDSNDPY